MKTLVGTPDPEDDGIDAYRREYKRLMTRVVTDIKSAMRLRGKIIR